MTGRQLPPVIVLASDGLPTDDFEEALAEFFAAPFADSAVRVAIAIGTDADLDPLDRFIRHPTARPLRASNATELVNRIKWATTAPVKAVSSPTNGPDPLASMGGGEGSAAANRDHLVRELSCPSKPDSRLWSRIIAPSMAMPACTLRPADRAAEQPGARSLWRDPGAGGGDHRQCGGADRGVARPGRRGATRRDRDRRQRETVDGGRGGGVAVARDARPGRRARRAGHAARSAGRGGRLGR